MKPTLILASASPRRRELLAQAGFEFQVQASSVSEVRRADEDGIRFATRLAREKAEDVFAQQKRVDPRLVLGADTVVECEGEVLGKPVDGADARRMLWLLAGRTHQVITGVAVVGGLEEAAVVEVAAELTQVTMRTLTAEEISHYVIGGEPMDKAGAYAIQGYAGRWIPRISGCYFNVVGLPLALVSSLLEGSAKRLEQNQHSRSRSTSGK